MAEKLTYRESLTKARRSIINYYKRVLGNKGWARLDFTHNMGEDGLLDSITVTGEQDIRPKRYPCRGGPNFESEPMKFTLVVGLEPRSYASLPSQFSEKYVVTDEFGHTHETEFICNPYSWAYHHRTTMWDHLPKDKKGNYCQVPEQIIL